MSNNDGNLPWQLKVTSLRELQWENLRTKEIGDCLLSLFLKEAEGIYWKT